MRKFEFVCLSPDAEDVVHLPQLVFLPKKDRPDIFCPECSQKLKYRKGRGGSLYASHIKGKDCHEIRNESEAHYQGKKNLLRQLQPHPSKPISFRLKESLFHFPRPWDEVAEEITLNGTRLDVVLLRKGTPVLALEVCETHPVTPEKASLLQSYNLPWVEMKAEVAQSWTFPEPLPLISAQG